MKRKRLAQQVKDSAGAEIPIKTWSKKNLVPSGSTLLNLACSDSTKGAFLLGKMVNLIGDSRSGKTLGALCVFAEAARQARFDEYRFIYDDTEAANCFDTARLFGEVVAIRMEEPNADGPSSTIQDFSGNVHRAIEDGRPFIYILDSLDALTSSEEVTRMSKLAEGKEVGGSYKMEKPKALGELLRVIIRNLQKTKSLLLIISQTRDNINPMSFTPKTRSGGNALRFYASHEIWLGLAGSIKKKDRVIGANTKSKITKNKLTGKVREVSFPIYYDYGIDDIGSCINFLMEEKTWPEAAQELGLKGSQMKNLIQQIEDGNKEKQLRQIVSRVWREIEDNLKLGRKPRYK
jgi:RecA/RadA recombinase